MIWPYSGLFGLYDFENGKRWRHMNFYFQLILKSPKNYENLGLSTSGLCLAFKFFFGLFFNFPDLQMSWIFQIIQIWIILKQFCHQIIFGWFWHQKWKEKVQLRYLDAIISPKVHYGAEIQDPQFSQFWPIRIKMSEPPSHFSKGFDPEKWKRASFYGKLTEQCRKLRRGL